MSTNTKQEAPETLNLWVCCHCHAPRLYGSGNCPVCDKQLHDSARYVRAGALATARSEVWQEAMKIANTCLQEHSHLVDEYGERQNPASCIWFELESAAANRQ